MWKFLKKALIKSNFVHLKGPEITSLEEFVNLADDFIDGTVAYDLAWDDFLYWKNSNRDVEKIRTALLLNDDLLTEREADMQKYVTYLLEQRNKAACACGLEVRSEIE